MQSSDTFLWHPHESLTSQEDDQERFLFMDSESIDIQGKVWHFFQGFWLLNPLFFLQKRDEFVAVINQSILLILDECFDFLDLTQQKKIVGSIEMISK